MSWKVSYIFRLIIKDYISINLQFLYSFPMRYFRNSEKSIFFPWLLAVAVLLRSFIAPGYMLSVSSGNGFGIIFCNGPVSIEGHTGHPGHHHGDDHTGHSERHTSPVCSQWSTSSLLVFNTVFEPVEFDKSNTANISEYSTPSFQQLAINNHVIRGPPHYPV